jgi:hypothetical protein
VEVVESCVFLLCAVFSEADVGRFLVFLAVAVFEKKRAGVVAGIAVKPTAVHLYGGRPVLGFAGLVVE